MSTSGKRSQLAELAYAEIAADFVTASAVDVDVPGLAIDVVGTGRPIMFEAYVVYANSVVNALGILSLKDTANTTYQISTAVVPVINVSVPFVIRKRLTIPSGTPDNMRVTMRVSAGNGKLYATAPDVAYIQALAL